MAESTMVPSDRAPQELSSEWSCHCSDNLHYFGAESATIGEKSPSVLIRVKTTIIFWRYIGQESR
jgi:hypothetical protein